MKKILLVIIAVALLLSGCNEESTFVVPKKEYPNEYAVRSILVLMQGTQYKAAFAERLVKRLRANYSFTVDDISKLYDYKFADYTRVVIIENLSGGHISNTEEYLKNYTGLNNIVAVAVAGNSSENITAPVEKVITTPVSENIPEKVEETVWKLRG